MGFRARNVKAASAMYKSDCKMKRRPARKRQVSCHLLGKMTFFVWHREASVGVLQKLKLNDKDWRSARLRRGY